MIALVILLILLWPQTVFALPSWVSSLPLWQWYSIPNTALSSVQPSPQPCGNPQAKITAWNGATLKTSGSVYIIGVAGGHNDYCGNEVDGLTLNTAAPQWIQLRGPSATSDMVGGAQYYLDLRRSPTHTYHALQFVNARNWLVLFPSLSTDAGLPPAPGGWPYNDSNGATYFAVFSMASNDWLAPTTIQQYTGGGDWTAALVVRHPVTDDIYYNRYGGGWWKWTQATNIFAQVNGNNDNSGNYNAGAIDSTRDHMLIVGSFGGDIAPRVRDLSGNLISVTFTGLGASVLTAVESSPSIVYDEANDTYLVVHNAGAGIEVIRVNASTWFVDKPTVTGTIPNAKINGLQNSAQYVPELGGIVLANEYSTNVKFMRTSIIANLNVGTLTHDGPATPEQLSLYLPVTGSLSATAMATVRYKPSASQTWVTGHPLYRMRADLSQNPDVGTIPDAFAWPIIDLTPGTAYDVEVTITDGAATDLRTATFVTRALPGACGAANKTITAGSSAATIQTALDGLVAGDVLQFQDGTYNLSGELQPNRSGTSGNRICIRGTSRAGTILHNSNRLFYLLNASHITFENMTLTGSGVDSSVNSTSVGIGFYGGSPTQTNITIRNITMTGIDRAIYPEYEVQGLLVYDNTITGNNTWTPNFLYPCLSGHSLPDCNQATWNDDGIALIGSGNAAFNNTLKGFGDTITFSPGGNRGYIYGNHFYRNEISNGLDDGIEGDYSHRNNTFYDNRLTNTATFVSLDPLYGGPFLIARNISVNLANKPFKWNSQNSGQFVYNNTIVRTNGELGDPALYDCPQCDSWYQPNNGEQSSFGFRNNLFVYRGSGTQTFLLESGGENPLDWDHNSWYPNRSMTFLGGGYANLAAMQAGSAGTATITPVFSGNTHRFTSDNITVTNPWTTTVTLGTDFFTEVTTKYAPVVSNGDQAKNSGVAIANITDGFSGAAPDRGAVIAGRALVTFGDRSGIAAPSNIVVSRRRNG